MTAIRKHRRNPNGGEPERSVGGAGADKRVPLKKLALTILLLGLVVLAWLGTLSQYGEDYIDRVFTQALTTFAVARALNGVISVAQGTKLAVEPAGVGANFALGEVLDPINDLIERFSWVMLASTTALGLQKLLLEMAGWWGIRIFLLGSALLFMACLWWPARIYWQFSPWVKQLLLMALLLNFAVPTVAFLSGQVFEDFIREKQQVSMRALERESQEFKRIEESLPSEEDRIKEQTWQEKLSQLMGGMRKSLDFEAEIQRLKVKSEEIAEHVIALIVVFVLQTIILPLLLIWLLLRAIRIIQ
ncbi:hypothetical protein Noc_1323 [Nitrosococcus oceani ATCC 19707]|uniref:Transmembrane protein n=2 Tax=Nitrosococcus oceani TaxID=1229 RepID=Q3JBH5_NITOC|nr:hypothetical protein [Nitrosococcus oceani]ABA57821.1 hypothetical protein Noc_1323 [Nitrosococcus oceani ATCC 19707]EDZ68120.1 hypothetical protein NOC27_1447 [Nitrosococcus oceani AFC27]KFI19760.1 hypothetical protein IB75_06895 [Nitrosococcus oceani C-27]GEM19456.1 hypothetical protein NONS58_08430 [Nitrosococcus oceani]